VLTGQAEASTRFEGLISARHASVQQGTMEERSEDKKRTRVTSPQRNRTIKTVGVKTVGECPGMEPPPDCPPYVQAEHLPTWVGRPPQVELTPELADEVRRCYNVCIHASTKGIAGWPCLWCPIVGPVNLRPDRIVYRGSSWNPNITLVKYSP
jgi:hypothetical protein